MEGGGYDFRGSILECTECEGGGNIKTQDWPSMLKLSNYVMIEANPKQKKCTLAVLCQQQNVTRTKLGPGTYQLLLLPGM